ncbi:MAG: hypothetical protein AAGF26_17225, partial [Cyanobacteria bacterium P01_G01_bin.49]
PSIGILFNTFLLCQKMKYLTEENLKNYLLSKGWQQITDDPEKPSIWHYRNSIQCNYTQLGSFLFPNSDYDDYQRRLREIPYILANTEDRSPYDIYADIALISVKQKLITEAENNLQAVHQASGGLEAAYLTGNNDLCNELLETFFDTQKII